MKRLFFIVALLGIFTTLSAQDIEWNFDKINNRTWIGKEFWSVPLEDWQVKDGRIECVGQDSNMRVNILNRFLKNEGDLSLSVKLGLLNENSKVGFAGFQVALQDETDNDIRSLCYYGKGINAGIDLSGVLILGNNSKKIPETFKYENISLKLDAEKTGENFALTLTAVDNNNQKIIVRNDEIKNMKGIVALVNDPSGNSLKNSAARFWFDNLVMKGRMLKEENNNNFGPILFDLYTLSRNILKMSVQFPPLGKNDEQKVEFQVKKRDSLFSTIAVSEIQKNSRIAVFKIKNWDALKDWQYRIVYNEKNTSGETFSCHYEGLIRRDPIDRPFKMAGMTGQEWQAYPYRPLTENLGKINPDILYFSGDQVYESNGGYGIVRDDTQKTILNYLGKWYMFGWAFGGLTKDRPTVCLPDDHEVYQGNLWGAGGKNISIQDWNKSTDCISGFVQPLDMLDVVMKTNCSQLPDPYDSTPLENGVPVYYTSLVYGKVSFAIVGDRVFKSGPENISWWEGRKDHIKFNIEDPSVLDKKGLDFLGERQSEFLEKWVTDWEGADMKCLLSQTVFSNSATHHGPEKMFLYGDMDSGGWPKSGRDAAIAIIRKAFALHICGDTHLTNLQQYGINEQRDACWAFCTPAISVGYERRFLPDIMNIPIVNRPKHGLPNTGEYKDVFGNYFYEYAVGNPVDNTRDNNRYKFAQNRASGFGLITFNTENRTFTCDALRFLANVENITEQDRFPGWPLTIAQQENYGCKAKGYLPTLSIAGQNDPVIQVINEKNDEVVYTLRIKGNMFRPKVFEEGSYTIRIGEGKNQTTLKNIKPGDVNENEILEVTLK